MVDYKSENVQVTFSNYLNAFNYFFSEYKSLCTSLISSDNIKLINSKILSFICDFEYGIPEGNSNNYRSEAIALFNKISLDDNLKELERRRQSSFIAEVEYTKVYYKYYIENLNLLGRFAEDLTPSFMPKTQLQKKMIRFGNDQPFYDTLTAFKKEVIDNIGSFNILDFKKAYNSVLIFYNAYGLFVNEKARHIVENTLSCILSIYLHDNTLHILKKNPHFTIDDKEYLSKYSNTIHYYLMFCNLQINKSFSNYGILPKIEKNEYEDRTLI